MNLAVVTNKPYSSSETFIKAQIDNLPFKIEHFWGFKMPFNYNYKRTLKDKITDRFNFFFTENGERKIIREFQKRKIQVVLAQYGMTGVEVLSVCQSLDIPLIVHFHGHDAVRKSVLEEYGNGYHQVFSYSKSKIISVSNEMTKRLIDIGCPKEKIFFNPCGPDDAFLKLKISYNKPQFIAIGRFVEKKAPHLLILAFKKVVKEHPEAILIMAGDGELRDSCMDLTEALNIKYNVIFPGRITPSNLRKMLAESIAFVQHSIEAQDGDMEGTPVAVLEASGAGLPVISTFHAGIPDVIINKETGLLCAEKDIDAMAENMIWILKNKDQAISMGEKGKRRIAEKYSMKIHIANLARLIKSMI